MSKMGYSSNKNIRRVKFKDYFIVFNPLILFRLGYKIRYIWARRVVVSYHTFSHILYTCPPMFYIFFHILCLLSHFCI